MGCHATAESDHRWPAGASAVLAWVVFRDNTDRRVVLGMLAIVVGAVLLAWPDSSQHAGLGWGALWIAGACLAWALDNNFTRKVSATDALFLAGMKGLVAGVLNTGIALALGATLPAASATGEAYRAQRVAGPVGPAG